MADSIFPYPGGKTHVAEWVVDHLPDHRCYVEPMAGSASVLVNKPPSRTEVINDRDGDVVHFFRTLRDRPDELAAWLRRTPYSRQLHAEYAHDHYHGDGPPEDAIERAGRWFYLRHAQFAGKYRTKSGFQSSRAVDHAGAYGNGVDRLNRYAERLRGVALECKDYPEVVEIYDGPETCFYFDPPYVGGDDLYTGPPFDHGRLVDVLAGIEGKWAVSYAALPDGLEDAAETVVARRARQTMSAAGHGDSDRRTDRTERLALSYDPTETPHLSPVEQQQLPTGHGDAEG